MTISNSITFRGIQHEFSLHLLLPCTTVQCGVISLDEHTETDGFTARKDDLRGDYTCIRTYLHAAGLPVQRNPLNLIRSECSASQFLIPKNPILLSREVMKKKRFDEFDDSVIDSETVGREPDQVRLSIPFALLVS